MTIEQTIRRAENEKLNQPLTELERHLVLKPVNITTDMLCSQPSCPICSEDYAVGSEIIQMQCSHIYHEACVIPWLEMKRKCPICRFEVCETVPPQSELEKLTETEIRQRIQWHENIPEYNVVGDR
jgi:hypothetical protein